MADPYVSSARRLTGLDEEPKAALELGSLAYASGAPMTTSTRMIRAAEVASITVSLSDSAASGTG